MGILCSDQVGFHRGSKPWICMRIHPGGLGGEQVNSDPPQDAVAGDVPHLISLVLAVGDKQSLKRRRSSQMAAPFNAGWGMGRFWPVRMAPIATRLGGSA